ncbi:MAG TPA: HNH endonuclease signature motif containing protein [Streptosporangiaceae bacterium]
MDYAQVAQIAPKFWARVIKSDGCWLWDGAHVPYGYGSIGIAGRQHGTHRVAWALANGRWPDGWVLHRCNNPGCVRPDHLYDGTVRQNVADMLRDGNHRNLRKTRCIRGHAFTPENTHIDPRGRRVCRACWKVKNAERDARIRASRPSRAMAARTHCPQGHPYDAANTWRDKRDYRYCRECSRQNTRHWREQQRQR